ncbi:MAG: YihY/virulence factor BrkB family protein [Actinobacteria bacterium]|nr:YihY/virulence factor BrkB family protein [Actinomycetota bacterium]
MARGSHAANGDVGGLGTWIDFRRRHRAVIADGVRSFKEHDLLSYASALAFQVLFALVPLALTALAVLGFLNLHEVWSADLAPRAREALRADAFSVLDRTVETILGQKQTIWLTFGAAFALWQISGAIRTAMGPLNRIYGFDETRPWWRRFLVSLALALAIAPLVLAAFAVVQLAPRVTETIDGGAFVDAALLAARWVVAVAFLTLAVSLLLRYAPAKAQPVAWAGIGSGFVIVAWIVASLGFGVYVASVADYRSIFGSLATAIVLMTYLYVSSLALFFGVQLDASLRTDASR